MKLLAVLITLMLGAACSTYNPGQQQLEEAEKYREEARIATEKSRREYDEAINRRRMDFENKQKENQKEAEWANYNEFNSIRRGGFKTMESCESRFGKGNCIEGHYDFTETRCYMEKPENDSSTVGPSGLNLPEYCISKSNYARHKKMEAAQERISQRHVKQMDNNCKKLEKDDPEAYDHAVASGVCQ